MTTIERRSQQQVEAAVNAAIDQLRVVMWTGRYSTGLALDIALPSLFHHLRARLRMRCGETEGGGSGASERSDR
jgi:hypothetical protein